MFNLFRRRPDRHQITNEPARNLHYVYVCGVAYCRRGDLIVCCDFTLPPDKQQWIAIHDSVDCPEITQIAYALGLIEGLIKMKAMPTYRGASLN